jgi:quinol monooxygenase YgiN
MAQILVHHIVEDYDKWKRVFHETSGMRVEAGGLGYQIRRKTDNPNDLFVLLYWENQERAREFMASERLKEKMQDAGVTDLIEVYFMEELESRQEGKGLSGEQLKWTA